MNNWFGRLFSRGQSSPESTNPALNGTTESRSVQNAMSHEDAASFLLKKYGLESLTAHVTAKNAMGIATFFGCVKLISNVISSLPYSVYRELEGGGSKREKIHNLDYIIHTRFNGNMSSIIARRTMLINFLIYGWAVAEIQRDGLRNVVRIIPYRSKDVTILHDEETDRYFFRIEAKKKTLSQDDVIFLRDISDDGNLGCSILNWQSQTIKIDLLAKAFAQKFYEKGTFMGGFLETPTGGNAKDEETAKLYKKRILEGLEGDDSGGFGFVVLGQGVKWHEVGKAPVEADLMPLFEKSDRDIAKSFGIPLSMIGDNEKTTSFGTGIEQLYIGVANNVLIPIAVQIEQEIDYKCFRKDEIIDGLYTRHNFKGLLRGDLKAQAEHDTKMVFAGLNTPDEIRALHEQAPYPKKIGSRPLVQKAMVHLDSLDQANTPKKPQKGNGKEDSSPGTE